MKAQRITLALALPLLVQACASYRPSTEVTQQMARTEAVIEQAERSGVAVNSLPELQGAKDKYAEAKRSLEKESREGDQKALQLAKQAEVDAQYATAKAQNTTQQSAAREVQSGTEALKDEANRNAAAPATATP
jgi:predicted amidohydrolase